MTLLRTMTGVKRAAWLTAGVAILLTIGCSELTEDAVGIETISESAYKKTDTWVGRWNGPEGTSLLLSKRGVRYVIRIRSLDRQIAYEGIPAGDRIDFIRNGTTESLRVTNGKDTGMKWLSGKTECLTIKPGEGFCRD